MKSSEYRVIRFFYTCSLGISFIIGLILTFQQLRPYVVLFIFLGMAILLGRLLIRRLEKQKKSAGFMMTLSMLNLLFLMPELFLRVVHFRYESGIQFGHPRPTHFIQFIKDDELFFTLDPKNKNVNSFGFPGREIIMPKPKQTLRLLYLGDSCTQQGYPEKVEKKLQYVVAESTKIECISLALSGYTSFQGKRVAFRFGDKVEPDIVFVYYGWNDHWLAFGAKDSEKKIVDTPRWTSILMQVRLVQWFLWIQSKITGTEIKPLDEVRVPLDEYRDNIREIVTFFKERNIPVILMTAPAAHRQLGVPDYLIKNDFAKKQSDVIEMHDLYTSATREIAAEENAALLDLADMFEKKTKDDLHAIFLSDGIHFTQAGLDSIAAEIVIFLKKGELLEFQ